MSVLMRGSAEYADPPSTEYDAVCTEVMTLLLQNIMGDNSYTAKQALADGIAEVKNKLPDVVVK